jgi:hypothetical protein
LAVVAVAAVAAVAGGAGGGSAKRQGVPPTRVE